MQKFPKVIYTRMNFDSVFFIFCYSETVNENVFSIETTRQKREIYAFSSVESGTQKKAFFLNIATERIQKLVVFFCCLHLIEMFGSEIYTENTHTYTYTDDQNHEAIFSLLILLSHGCC